MGKKVYGIVLIGLGLTFLVDLFYPDHHHIVFPWHQVPGFDVFFGFVGCLALMIGSLALGDWLLWRDTCSVIVVAADVGDSFERGSVAELHVAPGDAVTAGQALAVLEAGDERHTVHAPYPGTVAEIYTDVNEAVVLGETVLNLRVTKRTAEQMHHDSADADSEDADSEEVHHA